MGALLTVIVAQICSLYTSPSPQKLPCSRLPPLSLGPSLHLQHPAVRLGIAGGDDRAAVSARFALPAGHHLARQNALQLHRVPTLPLPERVARADVAGIRQALAAARYLLGMATTA